MRSLIVAAVLVIATEASGQPARPMAIELDARDAPRRLLHARLTIPAVPGPLTLLYPEWLPGEHGPTGPVVNLSGLQITAEGKTLPWRRDGDNMYAFHLEVPPGTETVTVQLDYLLPAGRTGFSSATSSTPALVVVSWNQVLLYPKGSKPDELMVSASLRLPPGWKLGTALPILHDTPELKTFAPASLSTMVDAPVLAGAHTRLLSLRDKLPVRLFVAADAEDDLQAPPALVAALRKLPVEATALFGADHFRTYTFLLTLSDRVSHFGLEHHESSDNRLEERFFTDPDHRRTFAGLLPHEMVHSWNGKYRRPADLQPGRFDVPMRGELLWVYEGLTTYLGQILTARSGLLSVQDYRDELAQTAADMELTKGRAWRPLADTAIAAQILYGSPAEGRAWRRGVDFYPESELIWLEVDAIIRQKSGGKASIEDFCRRFHGGESGPPRVVPYGLNDVIAALDAVVANDWKGFFQRRVYTVQPKPPLGGIEAAGWKVTYSDQLPSLLKSQEEVFEHTDVRYSIGIVVEKDGTIPDVVPGSPSALAGVPPGAKLIAVNGRRWTKERLRDAVRDTKAGKPIELIVESAEFVTRHALKYSGGARYPRLERLPGKPDLLTQIVSPLIKP